MDGKRTEAVSYQRQRPKVQQRSVTINQQEGKMDERLELRLEMIRTTENEQKNSNQSFLTVTSVRTEQKNKRSRWEKKGITFLMKIAVKNVHPEFKSFLTSIAKL